jgi:hypothetical protein
MMNNDVKGLYCGLFEIAMPEFAAKYCEEPQK